MRLHERVGAPHNDKQSKGRLTRHGKPILSPTGALCKFYLQESYYIKYHKSKIPFYLVSIMKIDPFVFTSRAAWMQRVADIGRTGHIWYIQGTCPVEKAGYLWDKFDRLYDIGKDKLQASRHRKAGYASARFLLLARKDFETGEYAKNLHWILMRTDGELNAAAQDARDTWKNLKDTRIALDGLELIRLTKPGAKAPVWTWRYTRALHDDLRNAIAQSIRGKRDRDLEKVIDRIWRAPGYAGVRAQGKRFMQLILAEWKRYRGKDPAPKLPERFGYVRRIKDKGVRASDLMKI